jgi:hypothetical protein
MKTKVMLLGAQLAAFAALLEASGAPRKWG